MNELKEKAMVLQLSAIYLKLKHHEEQLTEILNRMEDNVRI